jgi:predicted RNase H-like nuclease
VRVLGVDGARSGWLGALVDASGVEWRYAADIRDLLAIEADTVGIDMPIGLPDAGVRTCDVEARRLLGPRRSSVFAAPVRPVLGCATYAEARAVLAALGGPSMSAQAFGIVRAVRQVDEALTAADSDRVVEVHPELVLHHLLGADLAPKKTPEGAEQRLTALRRHWPDIERVVGDAPRPARADDAIDALACAVGARRWLRGQASVLGDGRPDSRGLPMRIAF